MIEIRTPRSHPYRVALASLTTLLLSACSDASGLSSAELEALRAVNNTLLEKIEIRVAQQQPRSTQSRFMTAQWYPPGSAMGRNTQAQLILVAAETEAQPKSTRHEKELNETKQRLKTLEQEHEALTKTLEESETECAQVKKQVETLTWANEVLVKELEVAYASRESEKPGSLPKGTRGIYVLRKGESLSRVAKAFYGDPQRWTDLVAANSDKIPDPDRVEAGTVILIPE